MNPWTARQWRFACAIAAGVTLLLTLPTTGDFGLTWDEPAYRYSQVMSAHWWERLFEGDSPAELLEPRALLYYWPYGRHGINFHPPLAGQLNLLTHSIFGTFMPDFVSRRMASVLEYSAAVVLLFGFLSWRAGPWVGGIAAGALLLMPRVYGQGHLAETDTPGMLIWALAAIATWKGLYDADAGRWRILVGVLLGLAFVEKMGTVLVILPLVGWIAATRLRGAFGKKAYLDWLDAALTLGAMLAPLALALAEILRISKRLPPAGRAAPLLFQLPAEAQSSIPGVILLLPLAVWGVRRLLARLRPNSPLWGAERPALEILAAILAFGPVVGWLGNPAWWRETLPRLAHYYMLNTARRGALPDIQILYFGQVYEYSLPWHNGWVLIAITVPGCILGTAIVGTLIALRRAATTPDRLPLYFLVHLATLPLMRMTAMPAHDGVRLMLPTFFFLAALSGWGTVGLADALGRLPRFRAEQVTRAWARGMRALFAGLVLGGAALQLLMIHPYELSYYNELIGGPQGAWRRGFELTYWYDAFTDPVLEEINRRLPENASVAFANELSAPVMVMQDLQAMGKLRGDILLGWEGKPPFPYMWLLTHDSKASAFSRLLYLMTPWYTDAPWQLDGLRVLTVADPVSVSRAWALQLMTDGRDDSPIVEAAAGPELIRKLAPPLARLWGDGLTRARALRVNEEVFAWARTDPEGLRRAADNIARRAAVYDPKGLQLKGYLERYPGLYETLMRVRPEALKEAVEILIDRGPDIRAVLTRYGYTNPTALIGGYLDQRLRPEAITEEDLARRRATPESVREATKAMTKAAEATAAPSQ